MTTQADIADVVVDFFAQWRSASMKLPSGWFGGPYDNCHELTSATYTSGMVMITLDGMQVLRVSALSYFLDGGTLCIAIQHGQWNWTSYSGPDHHQERLAAGTVEFHADPWRQQQEGPTER